MPSMGRCYSTHSIEDLRYGRTRRHATAGGATLTSSGVLSGRPAIAPRKKWKTFTTFSPEIKFLVKCLPFQRQVYIKLPCLVLFVAAVPIMPMPTPSCLLLACVLRSPQFFVSMLRTFWLARRGSLEKRGRFFRHTPHMPVGKEKRIGRIKVE